MPWTTNRIPTLTTTILLLGLVVAGPSTAGDDAASVADLINYPFRSGAGLDAFNVEGRSVQVYRLPFSFSLRSLDKGDPWGLKLTLPVSFGFHDFEIDDVFEESVRRSLETMTIVPGVEFELPLSARWRLRPFAEMGLGQDLDGGAATLIYSAGVKGHGVRSLPGVELTFGSGLEVSRSEALEGRLSQGFTTFELGVDARRALGVRLAGRELDGSLYLIARRFFDLEFARRGAEPIEIRHHFEVGMTLGTEPRWKLWKLAVPRIGLGYRFGDGLTSLRINFGFPLR